VEKIVSNKKIAVRKSNRKQAGAKNNSDKQHPAVVIELINYFLANAENGYLIITIQAGQAIKVEKTEKHFITARNRDEKYTKYEKPAGVHSLQAKIINELQDIEYGQLVVRINNGIVEQIEKTEKRRVNELEGVHGDGI
jgi:hypothetical protein